VSKKEKLKIIVLWQCRYFLTNPSVTGATVNRTCQDDELGGSLKSHLGTKFPFKKNEDM